MAYYGAIEHHRVHADDAVILDGSSMQNSPVSAGNVCSDVDGAVQYATVLDARKIPHHDLAAVSTQNGVIPDAGACAYTHIPDELGALRKESFGRDMRGLVVIRDQHVATTSPSFMIEHETASMRLLGHINTPENDTMPENDNIL